MVTAANHNLQQKAQNLKNCLRKKNKQCMIFVFQFLAWLLFQLKLNKKVQKF